uniref:HTH CENPB-type domain-containing protein n=1 Tax=Stomoxys calcitrans TaxID=35570 RepID=A0A1I8NS23_STOCA
MPAIRKCCIVGCMSNSRLQPNLQFFQFPRHDNPYYKQWAQSCQASMSRILPFKKPVVCAIHFLPQYVGGRRLTSNAVPTLYLDVPSNLKDVENQAMFVELERSRKHAYINAVVYEWLVRANLNPQLRGSITHGMIKEKAETAKQIIGCEGFMADNRWLNRFRETHLTNFAKKLASNQLKPMGPSLWIPDIVQDLQHSFPPTNIEGLDSFESVPEQYINYMKQYGNYEEDEDTDQDQSMSGYKDDEDSQPDSKMQAQAYYQNYQNGQNQHPSQFTNNNGLNSYRSEGSESRSFSTYDEYYSDRQQQQQQPNRNSRPPSHSSAQNDPMRPRSSLPNFSNGQAAKRRLSTTDNDRNIPNGKRATPINSSRSHSPAGEFGDRTANNNNDIADNSFKIKLPLSNGNARSTSSPSNSQPSNNQNSRSNSPKSQTGEVTTNGNTSPAPSSATNIRDLETYTQALEYLKPLEDFALFRENFRAIGLISQLEAVLRKGNRAAVVGENHVV